MRLAGEGGRGARARRLQEARRRRREADEGLGQMQLARRVPASIVVLLASSSIRWWDSELGSDLVEGALRRWEPELALEQRRLGGIPVGAGEV